MHVFNDPLKIPLKTYKPQNFKIRPWQPFGLQLRFWGAGSYSFPRALDCPPKLILTFVDRAKQPLNNYCFSPHPHSWGPSPLPFGSTIPPHWAHFYGICWPSDGQSYRSFIKRGIETFEKVVRSLILHSKHEETTFLSDWWIRSPYLFNGWSQRGINEAP